MTFFQGLLVFLIVSVGINQETSARWVLGSYKTQLVPPIDGSHLAWLEVGG